MPEPRPLNTDLGFTGTDLISGAAMPLNLSASVRAHFWITDLGFIAYWLTVFSGWLPPEWAYKEHDLPVMVAWNVSFAPLDLLASLSGLLALHLVRRKDDRARLLLPISLSLTFTAGLLALSFWTLRRDFELGWWLPNLYLTLWPLWTLGRWWLDQGRAAQRSGVDPPSA